MKRNTSRSDFREAILTSLGEPYITVNLSEQQLDKAIDASLKYFWKYHPHGSFEKQYVYLITATDITNGYIPVPPWIDAVVECLPRGFSTSEMSFATVEWQMTKETFLSASRFTNINLIDYVALKERLYNTQQVINGPMRFEFVRYQRRIIPYFKLIEGEYLAFNCYENVDPENDDNNPNLIDAANVWDDDWLLEYATAEAKIIWGNILKKFGNIDLPGGVSLDGKQIFDEGIEAKKNLEEYIHNVPRNFFMG